MPACRSQQSRPTGRRRALERAQAAGIPAEAFSDEPAMADWLQQASAPETLAYVDRLLDELLLTTVENFYNVSIRDLEKRAIRDPTTQLYNKEYFNQRLNEELRRAVRYALPIAVESLRALRKSEPSGETVTVSAADPLNLVGIIVPGERVPAISGRFVSFRDGVAVESESGSLQLMAAMR